MRAGSSRRSKRLHKLLQHVLQLRQHIRDRRALVTLVVSRHAHRTHQLPTLRAVQAQAGTVVFDRAHPLELFFPVRPVRVRRSQRLQLVLAYFMKFRVAVTEGLFLAGVGEALPGRLDFATQCRTLCAVQRRNAATHHSNRDT